MCYEKAHVIQLQTSIEAIRNACYATADFELISKIQIQNWYSLKDCIHCSRVPYFHVHSVGEGIFRAFTRLSTCNWLLIRESRANLLYPRIPRWIISSLSDVDKWDHRSSAYLMYDGAPNGVSTPCLKHTIGAYIRSPSVCVCCGLMTRKHRSFESLALQPLSLSPSPLWYILWMSQFITQPRRW